MPETTLIITLFELLRSRGFHEFDKAKMARHEDKNFDLAQLQRHAHRRGREQPVRQHEAAREQEQLASSPYAGCKSHE